MPRPFQVHDYGLLRSTGGRNEQCSPCSVGKDAPPRRWGAIPNFSVIELRQPLLAATHVLRRVDAQPASLRLLLLLAFFLTELQQRLAILLTPDHGLVHRAPHNVTASQPTG